MQEKVKDEGSGRGYRERWGMRAMSSTVSALESLQEANEDSVACGPLRHQGHLIHPLWSFQVTTHKAVSLGGEWRHREVRSKGQLHHIDHVSLRTRQTLGCFSFCVSLASHNRVI